jgi:hypothetical protein
MASSSSGSEKDDQMQANSVPAALRERLGPNATTGLLQVFDLERRTWSDDVLSISAERFERRLVETIAHSEAALRQEIGQLEVRLQQELSQMEVRILREMATGRVDLLKWSFVFWIGQVVAVSAVMSAMLRMVR